MAHSSRDARALRRVGWSFYSVLVRLQTPRATWTHSPPHRTLHDSHCPRGNHRWHHAIRRSLPTLLLPCIPTGRPQHGACATTVRAQMLRLSITDCSTRRLEPSIGRRRPARATDRLASGVGTRARARCCPRPAPRRTPRRRVWVCESAISARRSAARHREAFRASSSGDRARTVAQSAVDMRAVIIRPRTTPRIGARSRVDHAS